MNALISALGLVITVVAIWGTSQVSRTNQPRSLLPAQTLRAPGIDIKGRVVDEKGQPVAGVIVVARPLESAFPGAQRPERNPILTDKAGYFVLQRLVPGLRYSVIALHSKHPPGVIRLLASEDDSPNQEVVEIVLDREDAVLST